MENRVRNKVQEIFTVTRANWTTFLIDVALISLVVLSRFISPASSVAVGVITWLLLMVIFYKLAHMNWVITDILTAVETTKDKVK